MAEVFAVPKAVVRVWKSSLELTWRRRNAPSRVANRKHSAAKHGLAAGVRIASFGRNGTTKVTADAIRAINYATMMRTNYGVNVRETSNGVAGDDDEVGLLNARNAVASARIKLVAAVGNSETDADASPSYPPTYGTRSGKSMATPRVATMAALSLADDPSLSVTQPKSRLIDDVDAIKLLSGKTASGGRRKATIVVNAVASLGPSVAIIGSRSMLNQGETSAISFFLSSPSNDFTTFGVVVASGTLSSFTGSGDLYTATFTPVSGVDGVGTITVASCSVSDASGRPKVRGALVSAIRTATTSLEVTGTKVSSSFSLDASLISPAISAHWNGIEFLRFGLLLTIWTVSIGGTNNSNAAAGLTSFPVTLVNASAGVKHEVRITGNVPAVVSVVRTVARRDNDDHAVVTTTITNGTATTLSGVKVLENDDLGTDGASADTVIKTAVDIGTLAPGDSDTILFAMICGGSRHGRYTVDLHQTRQELHRYFYSHDRTRRLRHGDRGGRKGHHAAGSANVTGTLPGSLTIAEEPSASKCPETNDEDTR